MYDNMTNMIYFEFEILLQVFIIHQQTANTKVALLIFAVTIKHKDIVNILIFIFHLSRYLFPESQVTEA